MRQWTTPEGYTATSWSRTDAEAQTEEFRQRSAADRLERNAQAVERFDALTAATSDPVLRAVVELHGPYGGGRFASGPSCLGCDPGDYADSDAQWPCKTFTLIETGRTGPRP